MREAAIIATGRTPIGKAYRGAFNATQAPVPAVTLDRKCGSRLTALA